MQPSKILVFLSGLTAFLLAFCAGMGLFWLDDGSPFSFTTLHGQTVQIFGRGVYAFDTLLGAAGNRGTDAITLFVVVPLLVVSIWRYTRGSLRGEILMASALAYALYYTASMTFSIAYNTLVVVYIAALSASLFALILVLTKFDLPRLEARVTSKLPRRSAGAFLIFAGCATAFIWLSDIIQAMMLGRVPEVLASYTTVFTYAIDLAVITPSAILAGVMLYRREVFGYLLAPVLMILCALVGLAVISQTVFQTYAGIHFNSGQFIGLIGSWVVMGFTALGLLIAYFRSLSGPGRLG